MVNEVLIVLEVTQRSIRSYFWLVLLTMCVGKENERRGSKVKGTEEREVVEKLRCVELSGVDVHITGGRLECPSPPPPFAHFCGTLPGPHQNK